MIIKYKLNIIFAAYIYQELHTGKLEMRNELADESTMG